MFSISFSDRKRCVAFTELSHTTSSCSINDVAPVSYTHLDVYKRQARYYAIRDIDEARAFIEHPYLGANLREISEALLQLCLLYTSRCV